MLNKKVELALNKQVNAEFYSAYLYLSMAAWCKSKNLEGFANWMRVQYDEESFHAMKLFNYINERGGTVVLNTIERPKIDWKDIIEVFEDTYEHEQKVTMLINELATLATKEKDYATVNFMQWYVSEQVEEEASAQGLLENLKMIKGKGSALFMLDREAGTRVFTPPANE